MSTDIEPVESAAVICGQRAAKCFCALPPGGHELHECSCGVAWSGTLDGPDFEVVRWPQPFPDADSAPGPNAKRPTVMVWPSPALFGLFGGDD